jgi:hypothetical protein
MFICNKQINELIWSDIFNITYFKVEEYYKYLLNKNINTAQQKMWAIKKLWDKLYFINRDLKSDMLKFEKKKFEKIHYATLNDKEMQLLFEFSESYDYKPMTRKLFFEFLYIVGCRESVAKGKKGKGVKWSDITRNEDSKTGIKVWVVKFFDKGKWIEKSINDDFYNKLIQLKGTESLSEFVFDLNINTLVNTFNDFKEKYNLQTKNGRDVTIHSIKRATGKLVHGIFKDPDITMKHLQHGSFEMTKNYLDEDSYTDQASYMLGKNVDMDFFKNLSKDELLKLIDNGGQEIKLKLYYQWEKGKIELKHLKN